MSAISFAPEAGRDGCEAGAAQHQLLQIGVESEQPGLQGEPVAVAAGQAEHPQVVQTLHRRCEQLETKPIG